MKKRKKNSNNNKTPKVIEIVSSISSKLSDMDYGQSSGITRLSKEIETKRGHPHVYTVRDKLSEGFVWKEVLKDFKGEYDKNGILVRIEKIEQKEVNMERVLDILIKIQQELINTNKRFEQLSKVEKKN